jgi:4-amino-4-deoxy-L-arabinose transferase-like glycosyltransferase
MRRPVVSYSLLFGLLTIAARLPFLISSKIPFDSDEAVEGLMARHVLAGELPAFFWGQAFKGVPEVYVTAAAFRVFGSSVTVLKSVTLGFFATFVALNFLLINRMFGRWMAVVTSLLLIVAPPALVFWSLDASAEYVLVMLLGTVLLLLCLQLEQQTAAASVYAKTNDARQAAPTRGPRERERILLALGLVIGVGLWVHQIFLFYLLPAVFLATLRSDWWRQRAFGAPRIPTLVLSAIACVYLTLAVAAFITGGFSIYLGSITLGVHAPQKMLRIALGTGAIAFIVHFAPNVRREVIRDYANRYWRLAVGLLVGYSPVLIYSVLVQPARSPARQANLGQLISAAPDVFGNVIPILAGFKIATTERLDIPVASAAIIVAALASYVFTIRHHIVNIVTLRASSISLADDFFPIFIIFVPLVFVMSGAYLDTQSYRYLIPYYAGLSVALAAGSLVLAKQDTNIASVFVGTLLTVFALQQFVWYQKLTPDTESARIIACLNEHGIRGGYADYWTSYKLTFLSNEAIIFAPISGVDRYPAYTEFVRALPEDQRVTTPQGCVVSH